MKKGSKALAIVIVVAIVFTIGNPMHAKADSAYPNNVITIAGYQIPTNVQVNFNAGNISGIVGSSGPRTFQDAVGLTDADLQKGYYPVLYAGIGQPGQSAIDTMKAKASAINASELFAYVDVLLFKQTTESKMVSQLANEVTYTIGIPTSLYSSEKEFAAISLYNGVATVLRDEDGDYKTMTIKTDKSAVLALVWAPVGTFDAAQATVAAATADELDAVPKTGDQTPIFFFGIISLIAATIFVFSKKKAQIAK